MLLARQTNRTPNPRNHFIAMTLHDIREEIRPFMEHYHDAYQTLVACQLPLIEEISHYLMQKPGKELRPMLMILTACCCGMSEEADERHPLFRVASAVELLHNSSLLHDDVIDNAQIRRGRDTVNQRWDNKTAILVGDYFLSQVMATLNSLNRTEVTQVMNSTVSTMSLGELVQHRNIGNYALDEGTYRNIIGSKTAALMSASCELGALLSGRATPAECEAARKYGQTLGLAFQMRDDLLDYQPSTVTGKPQGNDIREHRATLPLILTLKRYNKKELLPLLQQAEINEDQLKTIIETVRNCGAIEDTQQQIAAELCKAKEALSVLKANRYRDYLACIGLVIGD